MTEVEASCHISHSVRVKKLFFFYAHHEQLRYYGKIWRIWLVEVDEALLGKKPTYATNTGQINSVFKI